MSKLNSWDIKCKVPFIENTDLASAVNLAIWMIIDKDFSLTQAYKSAAKKHGVTIVSVERIVRPLIPESFINQRKHKAIAGSVEAQVKVADSCARKRNQIIEDKRNSNHIASIGKES